MTNSRHDNSISSLVPSNSLDRFLLWLLIFTASCAPFSTLIGMRTSSPFAANAFIVLTLAAFVMFLRHSKELVLDSIVRCYLIFTLLGIASTLVMSVVLHDRVGALHGQTTFSTIVPSICWLIFNFVTVLYLRWAFTHVSTGVIDKALNALLCFTLIVSTLELVFGGAISGVLSVWLKSYNAILSTGRLCGIATEPSTMSAVLGLFCLPYCYARFRNKGEVRYLFAFLGLLVISYFTFSATVFVTVLFVCVGIAIREIGSAIHNYGGYLVFFLCLIGAVAILAAAVYIICYRDGSSPLIVDAVNGVLQRVTSSSDQSGAYRKSTIINDWKIFAAFPLFGVGDGNQGFFYAHNLPSWIIATGSYEVSNALNGGLGVLDGGPLIGTLVSGFGVAGSAVFIYWVASLFNRARKGRNRMGHFYDMYLIALLGSLPVLWMNLGFKGASVSAFIVFCLPCICDSICKPGSDRGVSVVCKESDVQ